MESKTLDQVKSWLITQLAERTGVPIGEIDSDRNILEYGIDSLKAINMVGEIEQWFGEEFPATIIWDYPTINSLSDFLLSHGATKQ